MKHAGCAYLMELHIYYCLVCFMINFLQEIEVLSHKYHSKFGSLVFWRLSHLISLE